MGNVIKQITQLLQRFRTENDSIDHAGLLKRFAKCDRT